MSQPSLRFQHRCLTSSRKESQNKYNGMRHVSLLKKYLLQEPVLKLPDLMKSFDLRTDASEVRVAAVLLQDNEVKLCPVGYSSKKLSLAEDKYPILEKECLAVVWGIRYSKLI